MSSATSQTEEEMRRDIKIMLRQGKSVDYVRGVFGYGPDAFAAFCEKNAIALPDAMTRESREAECNLSVRGKRNVAPRNPGRSSQVSFNTTPDITGRLLREARERQVSVSVLVDRIVTGAHTRGLWPDLLDSDSCSVASASHENHNNERR